MGPVSFDGIFSGFDRVAAALLQQESPEEKAYNDRLAKADGWCPPVITGAAEGFNAENQAPSAGAFLHSYTAEHAARISQARGLVLDIETTSLTPFSKQIELKPTALRVSRKNLRSTTVPFFPPAPSDRGAYADGHPGHRVHAGRRIRVITVQLVESGWTAAWDLDCLAPEERQRLAHDVLAGKILVGHNLSFDLAWLSWVTDAVPARIIDSMSIVRWHAHDARLQVYIRAAKGDKACGAFVKTGKATGVGFSLAECAAAFSLPIPDKLYQEAHNWRGSDLSPAHYEYCCGDVELPLAIVRRALKLEDGASLEVILGKLDGGLYAAHCEPALAGLVQVHLRGMPFSTEASAALTASLESAMAEQADAAIALAPDIFAPVAADLRRGGKTNALRQSIAAYLRSRGQRVPVTKQGHPSLGRKTLTKEGLLHEPFINRWIKINGAASSIGMLKTWHHHIEDEGRVHPMLAIATTSGRMSSKEPNSHGLPKDPAFRAIIKAGPGKLIVVADYAQIELCTAAAVISRELAIIDEYLSGRRKFKPEQRWVGRALHEARKRFESNNPPAPPSFWKYGDPGWVKAQSEELTYSYYQVLRHGPAMAAVLKEGLDLHLLTAVVMEARAGTIQLNGQSPSEYLRAADNQALKLRLAAGRQKAKAMNFGLGYGLTTAGIDGDSGLYAYGITDFGLAWSKQEAEEARALWFELNPEFRLWHAWTAAMEAERRTLMALTYEGAVKVKDTRVWRVATLSGRQMLTLGKLEALNYPVQGSGVDLILSAMNRLPEPAKGCLINVVHDEFVFEADANQAELVRSQVVQAMQAAADEMLGPYGIPVKIESGIGESWGAAK